MSRGGAGETSGMVAAALSAMVPLFRALCLISRRDLMISGWERRSYCHEISSGLMQIYLASARALVVLIKSVRRERESMFMRP